MIVPVPHESPHDPRPGAPGPLVAPVAVQLAMAAHWNRELAKAIWARDVHRVALAVAMRSEWAR